MKNSVKNVAIKTISFTGAVLHTTTVGTAIVIHEVGELVFKGSELIAKGEGYAVNKIDNTKSAESITAHRKDSTNESFMKAAIELQRLQDMAKDLVKEGKKQADKVITVAKESIKPKEAEEAPRVVEVVAADSPKTKDETLINVQQRPDGKFQILADGKPVKRDQSNFNKKFETEDEALMWAHSNLIV